MTNVKVLQGFRDNKKVEEHCFTVKAFLYQQSLFDAFSGVQQPQSYNRITI